ncbi:helix-turn-helix transcriptional regulator [Mycolicibacterium hippocampi]|uniref:Putative transcriptional regulator, AraC family n=1 Tax=Mycolicibacterium hippocampi TaxID=659824 RepID=A0A850PNK4_9MYCO|nr:helix-turn-helix transcriptional regulator [Mycolicibacterium hippocampi]NVN51982.1 putative transcriptional regulator, AraC family [Mycolicibacterium hippocampi]
MQDTPKPLAGGFLIDADEVGQVEEQIGAAFGAIRIQKSDANAPTRTRVWRSNIGALNVDDAEYSYDMSYQMEAPEHILLCRVHSGVLEETPLRDPARRHGTGAVVAFGAVEGRPLRGRLQQARYHMLNVPRRALAEVAGDDSDGEPVRLSSSTPVSPAANQHLVDVIDHIRHGLLGNLFAAQQPLVYSGVTRYLASSMLAAFPHTTVAAPSPGGDVDNHEALRRATAFIEDNAHRDISPADIAQAARISTRALETAFRRHRDCTATRHLQRVRLTYVHQDLSKAAPDECTVAEIANEWGFWNLRRFRSAYYKAYGFTPESTLNQ